MREIRYTSQFKRDFKREKKGRHGKVLERLLADVVDLLADDKPLPPRNTDHPLAGEWQDFRDCHLKPDLVPIYRKKGETILELVRPGSHSALF